MIQLDRSNINYNRGTNNTIIYHCYELMTYAAILIEQDTFDMFEISVKWEVVHQAWVMKVVDESDTLTA